MKRPGPRLSVALRTTRRTSSIPRARRAPPKGSSSPTQTSPASSRRQRVGFPFRERDTWTIFHSFAFDMSVWEMWGALVHGSRAVIVPWWTSRDPHAFRALLADERVTILTQTPLALGALIQADGAHAPNDTSLRAIFVAGETLDFAMLRPWFERHGDQSPAVFNAYGITETTVLTTARRVRMVDLDRPASFIGPPMGDQQIYLLDSSLEPVPRGVAGRYSSVALGSPAATSAATSSRALASCPMARGPIHRDGFTVLAIWHDGTNPENSSSSAASTTR